MKLKIFTLIILFAAATTSLFSQPKIADQRTIGSKTKDINYSDFLADITVTNGGGLLVGGYSGSDASGEKTQKCRGGHDYWIAKLGDQHKIVWDRTIGGKEYDYLTTLIQTTDGGYILGGISSSNSSGEKSEHTHGNDDYWIIKLDSTHHIEWDKTIGGSSYDWLEKLQQTADGGYILGGYSQSPKSGDKTEDF